jgi:hypothetical protein
VEKSRSLEKPEKRKTPPLLDLDVDVDVDVDVHDLVHVHLTLNT